MITFCAAIICLLAAVVLWQSASITIDASPVGDAMRMAGIGLGITCIFLLGFAVARAVI
jgi:hypothetical protein